jgi:hypothetical protein
MSDSKLVTEIDFKITFAPAATAFWITTRHCARLWVNELVEHI